MNESIQLFDDAEMRRRAFAVIADECLERSRSTSGFAREVLTSASAAKTNWRNKALGRGGRPPDTPSTHRNLERPVSAKSRPVPLAVGAYRLGSRLATLRARRLRSAKALSKSEEISRARSSGATAPSLPVQSIQRR
jgi:hypothetical protein